MALTEAQREQLTDVQRSMLKRLEKVYTLLSDAALQLANMEHALEHVDPDAVDPGLTALATACALAASRGRRGPGQGRRRDRCADRPDECLNAATGKEGACSFDDVSTGRAHL